MNEDKSTRYRRLHRRASMAGGAVAALFLALLILTGMSARLRDSVGSPDSWMSLLAYVTAVAVGYELLQLPFTYYAGVTLERRYGLSTQPPRLWWLDQLKSGGVSLVFTVGAAGIVWALLGWSPDRWWMGAAACFAVMAIALVHLAPVVLLPLFHEVRPLDRVELTDRIRALAGRAGVAAVGVFEWRMHEKTRKANAALAGIGPTRRILLSDTLLAEHSDDEIEVILAHELAHHVHRDIWSSLAFEAAVVLLGLYAADRVLVTFSGSFGLEGKGDLAALPLVQLTVAGVSIALLPVAYALSRSHERRADRYALEMTGNAAAFVSGLKRLGAQNLAEEQPSRVVELIFYSHPPLATRLALPARLALADARLAAADGRSKYRESRRS
jgi:STE24 endopeptidase